MSAFRAATAASEVFPDASRAWGGGEGRGEVREGGGGREGG